MPETIDCDPTAIAVASKCFCFPDKEYRGAVLYLLNQISGLNLTPAQLAEVSKCFCMNEKSAEAALLYLVCNIVNAVP
jgi:hypothetical protein